MLSTEYDFELDVESGAYDALTELFLAHCSHRSPIEFFDREILPVFDFDIYGQDFDPEAGYRVYRTETLNMLLIRVEDLDACHRQAFAAFEPGCERRTPKVLLGFVVLSRKPVRGE